VWKGRLAVETAVPQPCRAPVPRYAAAGGTHADGMYSRHAQAVSAGALTA
jgi:hypothetical protein